VSCSSLHDTGGGTHSHGLEVGADDADREDWDDAPGEDTPAEDTAAAEGTGQGSRHRAPKEPGPFRIWLSGTVRKNGYIARPFLWAGAVDGGAWFAHQVTGGHPLDAVIAVAVTAAGAEVTMEVRNGKRSDVWKSMSRVEIGAATVWGLISVPWTTGGWEDIVQYLLAAGALGLGARRVRNESRARRERREREPEPEPREITPAEAPVAIEAAPPPPDERMTVFTERFCQPGGQLDGVVVETFRELPQGFALEMFFPHDTHHSKATVESLSVLIAKLYAALGYDLTVDDISVGYVPGRRSEARCQLVITTTAAESAGHRDPTWNRWDGTSSYDPATGLIQLGRFADDTLAHYLVHTPGSGAAMGMIAGAPGQGKTGTLNVISAEAGLAMLCSRCGARGECGTCDPRRIMAVWLGDPQEQGLSVWRGRADLLGWGPEGVAELIDLAEAVSDERGKALAGAQSRGFDPRAGFPLILLGVDELGRLAGHGDQDMAARSMRVLADGALTWRRHGIHLLVASQVLNPALFPTRELREMARFVNFIAHRSDGVSSITSGITVNPSRLPWGGTGTGYIAGPDERPGELFRTKFTPETPRPGLAGADIRHLAERIERTSLAYDDGTAAVLAARGIRPRQVLTGRHSS
jgi:hypothetical protein